MLEKPGKWKKGLLAAGLVVLAGTGAAWLLLGGLDLRTTPDGEAKPSQGVDASGQPSPSAKANPITQTPDGRFALFTGSEQGEASMFTLERKDGARQTYNWSFAREWGQSSPELKYSDLNNDGTDEVIVHWTGIASDGDLIENLRVIDAMELKEYTMPLIEELLADRVISKITPLEDYARVEIKVDEQPFEKVLRGQLIEGWGDRINVGRKLTFRIQENPKRTYASVELYAGEGKPGIKIGTLEIDLIVEATNGESVDDSLLLHAGAIQFLPLNLGEFDEG
jgi:hypothetical protein